MRWFGNPKSEPPKHNAAVKRGMTFTQKGQVYRIIGMHQKVGNKWRPAVSGKKNSASYNATAILLVKNGITGTFEDSNPLDLLSRGRDHTKADVKAIYKRIRLDKVERWGYLNVTNLDKFRVGGGDT
jgi:hypothetical protein